MKQKLYSMKEAVSTFITSPGFGKGGQWREQQELRGGGPCAAITTRGTLRFDPLTKEMFLIAVHPGVTVEEIFANTGWNLHLSPEIEQTTPPSKYELRMVRKYGSLGFWTGGSYSFRSHGHKGP